MSNIREFRNIDLPGLVDVWIAHWSRCGPPPVVNAPILEQAVLSRTFFDASNLLVVEKDGTVQGWCHLFLNPDDEDSATIAALCLNDQGLAAANQLVQAAEIRISQLGRRRAVVGVVRDQWFGYCGLEPIGHGIGIPQQDQATTTILSDLGYEPGSEVHRMSVSVKSFRMPVSRDALQFRRGTQVKQQRITAENTRRASALAHLDIERDTLFDQRTFQEMTSIETWFSDPEAQVMRSDAAILDLSPADDKQELSPHQKYLLGSVIQSLAHRRISTLETAVNADRKALIDQLSKLQFESIQQGSCWRKELKAGS